MSVDHALQPTPGCVFSSATRFTATGPAWLSLGRSAAAAQYQTTARLLTISMYCCRARESLSRFQAMQ
jgi:hypothetical protein